MRKLTAMALSMMFILGSIIKSAINAGLEVPGLKEGKIRCLR